MEELHRLISQDPEAGDGPVATNTSAGSSSQGPETGDIPVATNPSLGFSSGPSCPTSSLTFLSLNVGHSSSLAGLRAMLEVEWVDVVFLQEVGINESQIEVLLRGLDYKARSNVDPENPSHPGTAMVWKSDLPFVWVGDIVTCRAQLAMLGPFPLLNIYGPSGSDKRGLRREFFGQDIFRAFRSMGGEQLPILGGDFNCVTKPIDIENGTGFNVKKCPALEDLVKTFGLSDSFRTLHPNIEEFTFMRASGAKSRLDRFYLPQNLLNSLVEVKHVASLSDHNGVIMKILLGGLTLGHLPQKNTKTYWKLNTSILKHEEFEENFKKWWDILVKRKHDYYDVASWWDLCVKPGIKSFCVWFSTRLRMVRKDTKKFLFAYLKVAQVSGNWEEVVRVKQELGARIDEEAMGFVVRSRFKQNAEREQASLFHANREVKNAKKCNLNKLKIGGNIVRDRNMVEEEVKTFFNALFNGYHDRNLQNTGSSFSPDFTHLGDFLSGLGKLDDNQRDKLHEVVGHEELKDVVKKCEPNKSPGLDGISYEFYQKLWHIVGDDFRETLNCQLERKRLIDSDTVGATRLAPKVDGVPAVDELRPITLLNCDYKILTKVFVARMIPIMVFIITSGQLCSVGNKNILFGLNNILSSILDIQSKKGQAALLSFDLFKAYDRVYIPFLLKVMRAMNFSERFCDWISMLHRGAKTRFILDFLTEAIEVSFSIRQGDPLSMLLFIIYVEPLLNYLRRRVTGIRVGPVLQADESYCDDINILTENIQDLVVIDEGFKKFEDMSGAILSRSNKSKVIGFGTWTGRANWPLAWLKAVSEVKVFGIKILSTYKEIISANWDFRFKKFENAVKSWASRVLDTISQRIMVLKVFALSRIWYLASALPIKKGIILKIEKVCGKFIWNQSGRILRIKMEELKKPVSEGGLGMPCVAAMGDALFLKQTLRMIASEDSKTVGHIDYWIGAEVDQMFLLGLGHGAGWLPDHFAAMSHLVNEGTSSELIGVSNWKLIKNKEIYSFYISLLPKVRIEAESNLNYKQAWKRLGSAVLESHTRDTLLLVIHNKIPTVERLHRIGVKASNLCEVCPGGKVADLVHCFCECSRVERAWAWVRSRLVILLGDCASNVSNWELLNLFFPQTNFENEILWLIGTTVQKFWSEIYCKSSSLIKVESFFGFLKFKYKEQFYGNKVKLKTIPGLLI